MSKPILKLEAGPHVIKVRDWGWAPERSARIELTLDGFCLAVVKKEDEPLMLAMAKKLQFALRAPERKKHAPGPRNS